jgi:transposase-like protein
VLCLVEDFPRTLLELEERFSSEQACRAYLFRLRWPDGFVCPRCGGRKSWPMSCGRWLCGQCRHQASVTAGTIFQDTRLPLRLWFRAIWQITSQKNGASALTVQRVLGLGSYKTAWTWLHKLRRAMVRPGRDRLGGCVEVDETYWGAREAGVVGRLTHEKALIMVAAQQEGPRIGRIRMARVPELSRKSLHGFIAQAVEPGSTVVTDGLSVYEGLKGYRHEPIVVAGSGKTASELLPRVHRVVSLLKRWLMGTLHGGIQTPYLDYYLDEFTFRFNRRTSASRGKLFYRLLQQAVQIGPTTYQDIVSPPPVGGG